MIAAGFHDVAPKDILQETELLQNDYVSIVGTRHKRFAQVPMDWS